MAKYEIVMVRHGESQWNQQNLFCGWFDADLSEAGVAEAAAAGLALKSKFPPFTSCFYDRLIDANYKFDAAHTSLLQRANKTCNSILEALGQQDIPINYTWRLNERHYGDLTGQNKKEAVEKFGADQVQIWRRSFATPPPAILEANAYFETIQKVLIKTKLK